jgi:hypothetical protein
MIVLAMSVAMIAGVTLLALSLLVIQDEGKSGSVRVF